MSAEPRDSAGFRREVGRLAGVLAALLALLAVSAGTALLPPAPWKAAAGLAVAGAKAILVASVFMRLRWEGALVRVFAAGGLFWLAILATLLFADYATR